MYKGLRVGSYSLVRIVVLAAGLFLVEGKSPKNSGEIKCFWRGIKAFSFAIPGSANPSAARVRSTFGRERRASKERKEANAQRKREFVYTALVSLVSPSVAQTLWPSCLASYLG
eukprot:2204954-Rhodomonas_salina.1